MTHNFHRLHPKKYPCFCANAGHARLTRVLRRNIITRVRRLRRSTRAKQVPFDDDQTAPPHKSNFHAASSPSPPSHNGQNQTAVVRIIPASTHSYFAPSPCLSQQRFFIGSGARRDLALTQKRNVRVSPLPFSSSQDFVVLYKTTCFVHVQSTQKSLSAGFASVCGETLQPRETAKMAVF